MKRLIALLFLIPIIARAECPGQLPTGRTGIARNYPSDHNIQNDSNVLFFDDFESYTSASQLADRWSKAQWVQFMSIDTQAFFAGMKSVRFKLPQATLAHALALKLSLPNSTHDVLFARVYTKFASDYDVPDSNHDGVALHSGKIVAGGGPQETGFTVNVENNLYGPKAAPPGYTHSYVYHPEQCTKWGDLWFPTGTIIPCGTSPDYFGPCFVPRSNFLPLRNRWYCYELMVKSNTPGYRDGRAAIWIDGNLVADFVHLRLRDFSTLHLDAVKLQLTCNQSPNGGTKWYDNFVLATQYIGPIE